MYCGGGEVGVAFDSSAILCGFVIGILWGSFKIEASVAQLMEVLLNGVAVEDDR